MLCSGAACVFYQIFKQEVLDHSPPPEIFDVLLRTTDVWSSGLKTQGQHSRSEVPKSRGYSTSGAAVSDYSSPRPVPGTRESRIGTSIVWWSGRSAIIFWKPPFYKRSIFCCSLLIGFAIMRNIQKIIIQNSPSYHYFNPTALFEPNADIMMHPLLIHWGVCFILLMLRPLFELLVYTFETCKNKAKISIIPIVKEYSERGTSCISPLRQLSWPRPFFRPFLFRSRRSSNSVLSKFELEIAIVTNSWTRAPKLAQQCAIFSSPKGALFSKLKTIHCVPPSLRIVFVFFYGRSARGVVYCYMFTLPP